MSNINRKVREQIQERESKGKLYTAYKSKADFVTNYQMIKAYLSDKGIGSSITSILNMILRQKYDLPWQEKIIRNALVDIRGKRNAVVSIPQFKFEKNVETIFSEFVERNFGKMVIDHPKKRSEYPFMFRDLIEKYLS